jgi:hypothetical protein
MKVIVIAGGARNLGKTHLVREIRQALAPERTEAIKFGHGSIRPDKPETLVHDPTEGWKQVRRLHDQAPYDFLLLETSSIPPDFTPDLIIFLASPDGREKPHCRNIREKAHILIDRSFPAPDLEAQLIRCLGDTRLAAALRNQFRHLYG